MKKALLTLFLVSTALLMEAQVPNLDNRIVVLGDATLELPADRVQVSVTLRYTDPTDARKAYNAHKAAEQKLVGLLREFKIDEKTIQYTLLNVRKNVEYYGGPDNSRRSEVVTEQNVIFKLNDIRRYPELQLLLIGGGFNQFSAVFQSSQAEELKNTVLEKAIEVARTKAVLMAKASGRTLGGVLSVRDTEETDPILHRRYEVYNQSGYAAEAKMARDGGALLDIPQKISLPAQVKVTFELK